LQIISEELSSSFLEYRTYSQESPVGKGDVSDSRPHKSNPSAMKKAADTEGYVDELPVNLDKSTSIQRYDQEEIETGEEIRKASSPSEIESLQGKLSDLTKQKSAISEIHNLFEIEGLSIEDRIGTLESLIDVLFKKDPSGGGYVERIASLNSDVEDLKKSFSKLDLPDSDTQSGEEII